MPFAEISRPSPNFAATPAHEQLGVCFHHSAMDFDATIARMLLAESQVSCHVLIASDGTRATLVADHHIAWHTGASTFRGRTRCNDFLLGAVFAGDTCGHPAHLRPTRQRPRMAGPALVASRLDARCHDRSPANRTWPKK